ncbi:MAG: acyltransferase [Pseudomonadales bacterium]|nr:acyltransferase [Pseudomonadales bacterium]
MNIWQQAAAMAAQTPADRNRYADFLRAVSILMVIIGHWLIAAIWADGNGIHTTSILREQPATQWLTWLFQVMPVFFIVGGYANAVSLESASKKGMGYGKWLISRLERLLRPLLPLVMVWTAAALVLNQQGLAAESITGITQAALVPVWFLAIYTLIVAMAPLAFRAWQRLGFVSVIIPAALAVATDIISFNTSFAGIAWTNYLWVWLTVHQLGFAWRAGRLQSTTKRALLAISGWAALAALVALGPYPLAMAGSPDPALSNTLAPKITLIALGCGQFGLLLLAQNFVNRLLSKKPLWTATILINSMIMSLYLWHITVMLIVCGLGFWIGNAFMAIEPGTAIWWYTRPAWMGLLFVTLIPVALILSSLERSGHSHKYPAPHASRQVAGAIIACAGIALMSAQGVSSQSGLRSLLLPTGTVIGGTLLAGIRVPGYTTLRRRLSALA